MKAWFCKHKSLIGLLAAIVVLYAALFALGITCPIKYITGISCPGCGMSRATWAMLRLDFSSAVHYHPLCFAVPFVAAGIIFTLVTHRRRAYTAILIGFAVIMVAVYFYRLLCPEQSSVVVANPSDGAIARAIRAIRAALFE